jgi:tRNA pseudouridine synthase 9
MRRNKRRQAGLDSGEEEGGGRAHGVTFSITAGGVLRRVDPYWFTFAVHVKDRWVGKSVVDALFADFPFRPREYYEAAVLDGRITVNGAMPAPGSTLVLNQVITHKNHVHEPPVLNRTIEVVHADDGLLVVCKPPSVPVHQSGRYRYNTCLAMLHDEGIYTGKLFPVHRIDRLTSGLLILAKSSERAKTMMTEIAGDDIVKDYLARADGHLGKGPGDTFTCSLPIICIDVKRGVFGTGEGGKPSETRFTIVKHLPDEGFGPQTLVECRPITGRTHQIRVHLAALGHPIANDMDYGGPLVTTPEGTRLKDPRGDPSKLLSIEREKEGDSKQRIEACEICATHAFFDAEISPATEIWLFSRSYSSARWTFRVQNTPEWAK